MTLPPWLRRSLAPGAQSARTEEILKKSGLSTVCQEALCPNRNQCFSAKTATFLIMGPGCTRSCGFCNVGRHRPGALDPAEITRLAETVLALGLRHVVITSSTRDDLPDGGAAHFAAAIRAVRMASPNTSIEVLTPDFQGSENALNTVLSEHPTVFNHNLETVRRLQPLVRPQASYQCSLKVLAGAAAFGQGIRVKSGLMVGLGESDAEILETLDDLAAHQVTHVTIGQYLAPSKKHLPVARYVPPEVFAQYEAAGTQRNLHITAGPFVRSSYKAAEALTPHAP